MLSPNMKTLKDRFTSLLSRHSISPTVSVRETMKRLNDLSGESMTLFVMDGHRKILGSVTDGDIRRALIAGSPLDAPVSEVMNASFLFAAPEDDLSVKMAKARKKHIDLLPVIRNGVVEDVVDLRVMRTHIPVEAVMMAGGRGERLRPLTDTIPKPLLPVDGRPIIDYNIQELEACGVKKIHVTVNYLASRIVDHFRNREGLATVNCVQEPKRLGTLGSLAYIDDIESEDVIVMNSDLLTSVDFEALYLHHRRSGADFTIAAVPYNVSVPFAIMHLSDGRVTSIEEKPTFNYFANGGVYIMKSELVRSISKGEYLDAPDFILRLIAEGRHVGCFHIKGTWIDIGSPDDYRMACELMARRR